MSLQGAVGGRWAASSSAWGSRRDWIFEACISDSYLDQGAELLLIKEWPFVKELKSEWTWNIERMAISLERPPTGCCPGREEECHVGPPVP